MANVEEIGIGNVTADVAIVTTAETAAVQSDEVFLPRRSAAIFVWGVVQITTGASTTSVTPRLRRGAGTGGTVVGDAVAITLAAAAGGNEQFVAFALDPRDNVDSVIYTLTVQQAAASGNGSILQASIVVFVLQ